jgi:hypothetical protein
MTINTTVLIVINMNSHQIILIWPTTVLIVINMNSHQIILTWPTTVLIAINMNSQSVIISVVMVPIVNIEILSLICVILNITIVPIVICSISKIVSLTITIGVVKFTLSLVHLGTCVISLYIQECVHRKHYPKVKLYLMNYYLDFMTIYIIDKFMKPNVWNLTPCYMSWVTTTVLGWLLNRTLARYIT